VITDRHSPKKESHGSDVQPLPERKDWNSKAVVVVAVVIKHLKNTPFCPRFPKLRLDFG